MGINIVEYTPEDVEAIKDLLVELQDTLKEIEPDIIAAGEKVRESYSKYIFDNAENRQGEIYLAKDGDKIVGFIAISIAKESDEDVEYLYVSDMVVSKEYRGKGIGKQLLAKAEEYAKSKNLKYIRIGSLVSNPGATKLYKNFGFNDYLSFLQKKLD
ncbi:MAG TPA: GNAT family N-acetyltransferase [Candidatus Paceibacterota bacterium]